MQETSIPEKRQHASFVSAARWPQLTLPWAWGGASTQSKSGYTHNWLSESSHSKGLPQLQNILDSLGKFWVINKTPLQLIPTLFGFSISWRIFSKSFFYFFTICFQFFSQFFFTIFFHNFSFFRIVFKFRIILQGIYRTIFFLTESCIQLVFGWMVLLLQFTAGVFWRKEAGLYCSSLTRSFCKHSRVFGIFLVFSWFEKQKPGMPIPNKGLVDDESH